MRNLKFIKTPEAGNTVKVYGMVVKYGVVVSVNTFFVDKDTTREKAVIKQCDFGDQQEFDYHLSSEKTIIIK